MALARVACSEIDGQLVRLPRQQFRLLAHLLAYARARPGEFLELRSLDEFDRGHRQALGRVRKALDDQVPGLWEQIVVRDGQGRLRLNVSPEGVSVNPSLLTGALSDLAELFK